MPGGLGLAVGRNWQPFWRGKNVFSIDYTSKNLFHHFFGL
jgi:hypothetical protein